MYFILFIVEVEILSTFVPILLRWWFSLQVPISYKNINQKTISQIFLTNNFNVNLVFFNLLELPLIFVKLWNVLWSICLVHQPDVYAVEQNFKHSTFGSVFC